MRPLKLVLTAFGPYRDTEVIDFQQLQDHRLFVISGNTGAGKTTIFDAICYALYGSASGEDRAETRNLRSQFADENIHTCVELVFVVKDKQYRVLRQMKHRKGNNKSETGEKIELFELTPSGEVPAVDRFVIRDVDMKLAEIIGLSKDQFSQIVMLPQGEFRKLLTSSTDNKEDILRKIFRTEQFEQLEQIAGAQYKGMQEKVKDQLSVQWSTIGHIGDHLPMREESLMWNVFQQEQRNVYQVIEALGEEEQFYKNQQLAIEQQKIDQAEMLSTARKALQEAGQNNEKLAQYELKCEERKSLLVKEEEMKIVHERILLGERAQFVAPYVSRYERAQHLLTEQQKQLTQHEQVYKETERQANELGQKYEECAKQEDLRKGLQLEVHQLQEMIPTILDYKTTFHQLKQAEELEKLSAAKVIQLDNQIQEEKAKKLEIQEQLQKLETVSQDMLKLQSDRAEIERQGKLIGRMIEYWNELLQMEAEGTKLATKLEHIKLQVSTQEQKWLEGQASELARHLHNGDPCPVCGSLEHPQLAIATQDRPTKEQLDETKQEHVKIEQELMTWRAQKVAKLELLDQQYEQLSEQLQATISYSAIKNSDSQDHQTMLSLQKAQLELRDEWKRVKELSDRLKLQSDHLQALKEQLQQLEVRLEQQDNNRTQLQQTLQSAALQKATLQSKVEQLQQRIPDSLRNDGAAEIQLRDKQARLTTLEQQWKQVVEEKAAIDKKVVAISSQLEHTSSAIKQQQQEVQTSSEELKVQLEQNEFSSLEQYQQAQLHKAELDELTLQYKTFYEELAKLNNQIELLEKEVADKSTVDLEPLQLQLEQLQQQFEQYIEQEGKVRHYLNEIEQYRLKLNQNYEQIQQMEQQLAILADLYSTMKGDNPMKLSFERYILIDYLEQILVMANIRLHALSNGQFELKRSERLETHGKQSGLGLDVYDAYTGQNRDVKTLSGGEKFNAALCLALGMTDVIQSHQGGVSIEMMFIDEGFGSLDEESLQKAITTLVDLQRAGRMIGVISHVQELKDALPACLEVSKNRDGHSHTKFIVK